MPLWQHFLLLAVYFCWSRSPCKSKVVTNSIIGPPIGDTDIMSKLSQAIRTFIHVFDEYAGKEGDKSELTKRELKDLINNELGDYIKSSSNHEQADKILKDLDTDPEGVMDFQGYTTQVAHIARASRNVFTDKK